MIRRPVPRERLASRAVLAPRMLSAELAAAYMGVSVPSFMRLVDEGIYPQPQRVPGHSIVRWDRFKLDQMIDGHDEAAEENTVHKRLRELKAQGKL